MNAFLHSRVKLVLSKTQRPRWSSFLFLFFFAVCTRGQRHPSPRCRQRGGTRNSLMPGAGRVSCCQDRLAAPRSATHPRVVRQARALGEKDIVPRTSRGKTDGTARFGMPLVQNGVGHTRPCFLCHPRKGFLFLFQRPVPHGLGPRMRDCAVGANRRSRYRIGRAASAAVRGASGLDRAAPPPLQALQALPARRSAEAALVRGPAPKLYRVSHGVAQGVAGMASRVARIRNATDTASYAMLHCCASSERAQTQQHYTTTCNHLV